MSQETEGQDYYETDLEPHKPALESIDDSGVADDDSGNSENKLERALNAANRKRGLDANTTPDVDSKTIYEGGVADTAQVRATAKETLERGFLEHAVFMRQVAVDREKRLVQRQKEYWRQNADKYSTGDIATFLSDYEKFIEQQGREKNEKEPYASQILPIAESLLDELRADSDAEQIKSNAMNLIQKLGTKIKEVENGQPARNSYGPYVDGSMVQAEKALQVLVHTMAGETDTIDMHEAMMRAELAVARMVDQLSDHIDSMTL